MTSPVDSAIPSTGEGPRGDLTDLLKSRYAVVMTSLTELRGADLSGHRFAWLLSTAKLYKFDATSTAADDGVSVIHDAQGNRFLLQANGPVDSVNGQVGEVALSASDVGAYERVNRLPDGGRFGNSATALTLSSFVAPPYFASYNSAVLADGGKFTFNNSTYGGSGAALNAVVQALVERQQTEPLYKQYGFEWHALKVTAGAGTAGALTTGGTTRYLALSNPAKPMARGWTFSWWMEVSSGSCAVMKSCVDGAKPAADNVIVPADGWVHVAREHTGQIGYDGAEPRIYAEPGTVFHVAQFALFSSNGVLGDTPYLVNIPGAWS